MFSNAMPINPGFKTLMSGCFIPVIGKKYSILGVNAINCDGDGFL